MVNLSETLLGDQLPFEDHIEDQMVLMTGNGVMAMWSVEGVYPDTSDKLDEENWFGQLHTAIKNIAAADVEIVTYQCRGEADRAFYDPSQHNAEFASDLERAYLDNLFRGTLYSNPLFLAIQIHGPNQAMQSLSRFFADATTEDPRVGIRERAQRLTQICDLVESQLQSYGLRRLGYITRGVVVFSEIAEAIVLAMTGRYRQIAASTGRMANAMFSERLKFRRGRIEFHGAGDVTYGEMYAFKEYPATTWPGMFYGLSVAPYCCTLVQSYRFLSNADALSALGRKQNFMRMGGDKGEAQIADLQQASSHLMNREWVLGDHSLVLICFADTPEAMSEVGNEAWRDLANCGLVATKLTKALQAGYLSMMPGAGFWRPRPGFVKSSNFIAFSPLYNWPAGAERGFWPGPPIAIFRTMAGTPYRFFWHPPGSDVGNTLITGMTGAGKTLLTAYLKCMTASRARIIALDHKRGWQFIIGKMGGDYAVLGGRRPNFAPLKALDTAPQNMEFLVDLIRGCIGGRMTEEEGRRLNVGLSAIMTLPPEDRCLGEFRAFFDNTPEGAGVRLDRWCAGNELGWVIDAPCDTVRFGDLSGLDVTALLENERARGVAMSYLMHRIAESLDGSPCLIPIDEGWRALIDPTFRGLIEKQLRTIRSKNGAVVFITQSPGDIIESGLSRILLEMCPTQFFLANPRGLEKDYREGFRLTAGEYEAFRRIQPGQGIFLLKQGDMGVVCQLPMRGEGMAEYVQILSARESDLRLVEEAA